MERSAKKGIVAFSLVFFSFNTGVQYTVVLGSLPVFASVFPPTAISAGFPLSLCRQRSPWPPAGYFANNGSLKKWFRFAMFLSMLGFIRCMFADSFVMPLFGRVNPASADSCWFKSPPSSERILNERTERPSIFGQHRKGTRRTAYWKPLRLFIRLEGQFCYSAFDVCRFFFLSNRFG